MEKASSKYLIVAVAVIGILLITNPSYTKFNNYSKETNFKYIHVRSKIVFNGFLFSIYTKEIAHTWGVHHYAEEERERIGNIETVKYLGILSNFFELSRIIKDAAGHPFYESK